MWLVHPLFISQAFMLLLA